MNLKQAVLATSLSLLPLQSQAADSITAPDRDLIKAELLDNSTNEELPESVRKLLSVPDKSSEQVSAGYEALVKSQLQASELQGIKAIANGLLNQLSQPEYQEFHWQRKVVTELQDRLLKINKEWLATNNYSVTDVYQLRIEIKEQAQLLSAYEVLQTTIQELSPEVTLSKSSEQQRTEHRLLLENLKKIYLLQPVDNQQWLKQSLSAERSANDFIAKRLGEVNELVESNIHAVEEINNVASKGVVWGVCCGVGALILIGVLKYRFGAVSVGNRINPKGSYDSLNQGASFERPRRWDL